MAPLLCIAKHTSTVNKYSVLTCPADEPSVGQLNFRPAASEKLSFQS